MKIKCNYERTVTCARGKDICWQQATNTHFYFDAHTTKCTTSIVAAR